METNTSALQFVLHAGGFVKFILFILAGFSIVSWGVILQKLVTLSFATRQTALFRQLLDAGTPARELEDAAKRLTASPLANVFRCASEGSAGRPRELAIRRCEAAEVEQLQAYLPFLATTGSTTPFIGLLGTVWGILEAFRGIGSTGSAALAVVAPAIAEALITTAAGLLAAIPAVIAYNAFLNWVRKLALELEPFTNQLLRP